MGTYARASLFAWVAAALLSGCAFDPGAIPGPGGGGHAADAAPRPPDAPFGGGDDGVSYLTDGPLPEPPDAAHVAPPDAAPSCREDDDCRGGGDMKCRHHRCERD